MTKERYREIAERNKNNKLILCYEIFCEEKKQIPLQHFQEALPNWLMTMQPDVFVIGGGDLNHCTEVGLNRIVEFLNKKYE